MRKTTISLAPVLTLAMASLGATAATAAPTGDIDVVYNCETGSWEITSTKALSNVVVSDGTEDTKTELDELTGEVHTYSVSDPDAVLTTIWVKAGNNKSGDGPGYGERFELPTPGCDPDADGDGYRASEGCNDADPAINPGATDIPNDGIDQNCDGSDLVVGEGELRFTLLWASGDDLDLHVIDPFGERIWYSDTTAASGGVLDRDDNRSTCVSDPEPGGVENVYWPVGAAPAGTYTVEINNFNDCNDLNTGTWELQVHQDGALIASYTGEEGDDTGVAPRTGEFQVFKTTHVQP